MEDNNKKITTPRVAKTTAMNRFKDKDQKKANPVLTEKLKAVSRNVSARASPLKSAASNAASNETQEYLLPSDLTAFKIDNLPEA